MDLNILGVQNSSVIPTSSASRIAQTGTSFASVLSSTLLKSDADLDTYFQTAAEQYGIPVELLKAVGMVESSFNTYAVSSCGAQGIMQLMPSTARSLGVTNAFDPEQNIMGGAKYLRQMLNQFNGDVSLALAAYNAGPGAVTKYNGIPPYAETQNYVSKVLNYTGGTVANTLPTYTVAADTSFDGLSAQSASGSGMELEDYVEIIQTSLLPDSDISENAIRVILERPLFESAEDEEDENREETEERVNFLYA